MADAASSFPLLRLHHTVFRPVSSSVWSYNRFALPPRTAPTVTIALWGKIPYNNVCGINRFAADSRGGSRAVPERRLPGTVFMEFIVVIRKFIGAQRR